MKLQTEQRGSSTAILLTLWLALSPYTYANSATEPEKEQWYQINLLVFQHLKGKTQGANAEQWPQQVDLAYPKRTIYLRDTPDKPLNPLTDIQPNYSLMNDPESGFIKEKLRIRRSAGFRTLYYQQWYQKLGTGVTGQAIAISGGRSYGERHQLEGWVRFSQKRYLHLEVDLWLHEYDKSLQQNGIQTVSVPQPVPEQEQLLKKLFDLGIDESLTKKATEPLAKVKQNALEKPHGVPVPFYIRTDRRVATYVMHQGRRMKSEELHYLDHPLLGVIVEAIPYEPEQAERVDQKTAIWLRPPASTSSQTE